MIVSVTERGTFRRCRRKWHLTSLNRGRITPIAAVSKALDLGTLVHKTLAEWILNPKFDPQAMFNAFAAIRLAEINANYERVVGIKPSDDEIAPFLEACKLGEQMMANYRDYHKTPLPTYMTFAAPEQPVQVPIPGTEHPCVECDGDGFVFVDAGLHAEAQECIVCGGTGKVPHFLKGTLDGLIQDKAGKLYILEHKTYGRRPRLDTLYMNDQFLAYIWVLSKLNIASVGGLAYDGMWKKANPPRNGSMADLFIRDNLTRSQDELDEFEFYLAAEVNDMAAMPDDVHAPQLYMNRRWEGCTDCTVKRLCQAISRKEDIEYVLREHYTTRAEDEPLGMAQIESPEVDEEVA